MYRIKKIAGWKLAICHDSRFGLFDAAISSFFLMPPYRQIRAARQEIDQIRWALQKNNGNAIDRKHRGIIFVLVW